MNNGTRADRFAAMTAPRTVAAALASLFFIALLLRNPDIPIKYVSRGLTLCTTAVIPTLFPFMALSELLVRTGGGELMGRLLRRPMHVLFGLSGAGSCAYLLGAVCGFPVGTRAAVMLYDRGLMTRRETERLVTFCNYPSSAFMISAVGTALWHDRRLGAAMYVSVLLAGTLCGIAGGIPARIAEKKSGNAAAPLPAIRKPEPSALPDSVTAAALSTLNVCAYVAFFSCVVGCISCIISRFSPSRTTEAVIYSLFEVTSGAAASSAVRPTGVGILLCTAAAGWSGLSVHMQIFSVCSSAKNARPRLGGYLISKAVQAPLSALIMLAAMKLFPSLAQSAAPTGAFSPHGTGMTAFSVAVLILFLSALAAAVITKLAKRKQVKEKA